MKGLKQPWYFRLTDEWWKVSLQIAVVVTVISIQSFFRPERKLEGVNATITAYNNFTIFKQSFFHLLEGKDLYQEYPTEHWDLYKYSPAFALLIAPIALLPDFWGILLWNGLNGFIFFYALWKLPFPSHQKRLLAILFITVEAITSIQNEQSNALIAGLIILAFVMVEKRNLLLATLFITLTVFIKLFGIVAFSLLLLYPDRLRSILYSLMWIVVFTLLPLVAIPYYEFVLQYKSWLYLLQNDHDASYGYSVMGWIHTWSGQEFSKNIVVLLGALLFCLPLLQFSKYKGYFFRLLMLCSVLLWVVVFNHKAESPTFVIAVSGVAVWFFSQKFDTLNFVLLLLVLFFTVLSPTDIFPREIRDEWVKPYALKGIPCVLVWLKIIIDLFRNRTLAFRGASAVGA